MPVRRVLFVFLILFIGSLSGCLADNDEVTPQDTEAETTILEGRILDAYMAPVAQAMVHLIHDNDLPMETTTDSNGTFVFHDVPQGRPVLEIVHECCLHYMRLVNIDGPGMHRTDIILEPLPSTTPFVEKMSWNGFIACGATVFAPITHNCTDPNHDVMHELEAHNGLRSLVVALDWEPSAPSLDGELTLRVIRVAPQGNHEYVTASGPPPVELHINATQGSQHDFTNIEDEPWDLRIHVRPGGTLSLAYQQPFSVWYEMHHWEEAPEDATALPS